MVLIAEKKLDIKTVWQKINPYIIIMGLVVLAIYTAIVQPQFISGRNLEGIMRQFGALSLTSVGMTFIIIGGYIDMSVVGMFSFSSVFTISLIPVMGEIPAILVGLAMGTFLGFLDGLILTFVGAKDDADACFVTYGLSMFYFAMALIWSNGNTIRLPEQSKIIDFIGEGTILNLPISFFIFLVVVVIAHIFLMKTKTGLEIRMVGGNRYAARICGISSKKTTILIYTLLGLTVAIGAIIAFSRTTTAAPVVGKGFDLNSILAVVIGGTRVKGGLGSVLRTVIGVLLITVMANALNMIGVSVYMQSVAKGAILMLAIWLDYRRK